MKILKTVCGAGLATVLFFAVIMLFDLLVETYPNVIGGLFITTIFVGSCVVIYKNL